MLSTPARRAVLRSWARPTVVPVGDEVDAALGRALGVERGPEGPRVGGVIPDGDRGVELLLTKMDERASFGVGLGVEPGVPRGSRASTPRTPVRARPRSSRAPTRWVRMPHGLSHPQSHPPRPRRLQPVTHRAHCHCRRRSRSGDAVEVRRRETALVAHACGVRQRQPDTVGRAEPRRVEAAGRVDELLYPRGALGGRGAGGTAVPVLDRSDIGGRRQSGPVRIRRPQLGCFDRPLHQRRRCRRRWCRWSTPSSTAPQRWHAG